MAVLSSIKLPNNVSYDFKDKNALPLTGGAVTGSVSFGSMVTADSITVGSLIATGAVSMTNNLQVNTINGVSVGDSPKFTDNNTTYSAGTGLSLSSTTFSVKLGYTTSGNNRGVQADSNGNLYVVQKDDNNKVSTAAVTSGTTYYPVVGSDTTSAATKYYDKTGITYTGTNGTTSNVGSALLILGNSTTSGTANNKRGQLRLYGSTAYHHTLQGAPTTNRTLTLPDVTGTVFTDQGGDVYNGINLAIDSSGSEDVYPNLTIECNNNKTFSFKQTKTSSAEDAVYDNIDIGFDYANVDGPLMGMRSASAASMAGEFHLIARSSVGTNEFVIKPDGNYSMTLNTSAASGTEDGDLYAAIHNLGWDSDVLTT